MKAYFIPGAFEDLNSSNYKAVLDVYKDVGYDPKFVKIDWAYRTMDDYVEQARGEISKGDLPNSLLSGFSFGSIIALSIAAAVNPKRLLLFSLSPYFKEDFPITKSWEVWAGKKRVENLRKLSFNELAPKIQCPTILFAGTKEVRRYGDKREREAHKRIAGSKYIIIPGVGHDVTHPKYVEAVREELAKI
jgi:esterase/lipase